MQIYVHRNNQQLGPFTEAEIRAQLAAGTISLQDHVWWQGQASWLPLGQTSLATPGAVPAPGLPPVPERMAPIHPMHAPARPTSQLAIWSLVCGGLSVFCYPFTSIPAIILGHMGLAEIRKNPSLEGRGLALTGTILGYLFTGFVALVVFLGVMLAVRTKDVLATITSQLAAAQAANDNDNSSTNTDQSTNAPDQTTPTATPATNSDQPTATPAASDQSTNGATATPSTPANQ